MVVSKVFYTDFQTSVKQNMFKKLRQLMTVSGMGEMDFEKKMTAVKMHFGEPGNMAYIRHNYITEISRFIRSKQGIPFLTDTNTLYKGRRSNAVDHLQAAMENGFGPFTTGCHVIIADGLKGMDYREIEINGKYVKKAKIAIAIADADIFISVAHFKGHELTGIGGALKNTGMGCGSVGGKLFMHSGSQPIIDRNKCTGCNLCVMNCAHDAIHLDESKIAEIDYIKCTGCGQCIAVCRYDSAKTSQLDSSNLSEKIMEYALAVLKNKPVFFINFISDVSTHCDCWGFNSIPITDNIGILASSDPVAIDQASADMVNNAHVNQHSLLGGKVKPGQDKFTAIFPNTNWVSGLAYAESIGLGNRAYEIVKV